MNGLLKSCPLCICGEILSSKHLFNDEAMLRKPWYLQVGLHVGCFWIWLCKPLRNLLGCSFADPSPASKTSHTLARTPHHHPIPTPPHSTPEGETLPHSTPPLPLGGGCQNLERGSYMVANPYIWYRILIYGTESLYMAPNPYIW